MFHVVLYAPVTFHIVECISKTFPTSSAHRSNPEILNNDVRGKTMNDVYFFLSD